MEGIVVQVKAEVHEDISENKTRRRTTRKSAVAAAAAIRVKSEPSPDSDLESKEDDGKRIIPKQCRICLSRNTLTSLFKTDNSHTFADKIMSICNSVKIVPKDLLPQYVCNNCVQNLNVAFRLKSLCEETDKDLRFPLKKMTTKVKKQSIDKPDAIETADGSDSDSDYGVKRKRKKKTSGLKRQRGSSTSRKRGCFNKSRAENGLNSVLSSEDNLSRRKRVKSVKYGGNAICHGGNALNPSKTDEDETTPREGVGTTRGEQTGHLCLYCEAVLPSRQLLREHKKTHSGNKPFICKVCGKSFKLQGSYSSHIQKHKDDEMCLICQRCDNKKFASKVELKKHLTEEHKESLTPYNCEKCKKTFKTQVRLYMHRDGKCPAIESTSGLKKEKKKNNDCDSSSIGKELFKCVAPMTTTYWSDSFSD